jgi:hypothetical protein
MSLLILEERKADEGPCGFRFRLAASNLLSVRDLDQIEISAVIGPFNEFESCRNDSDAGTFNPWVHRWSRFCPSCLASRQSWLLGWEVLFADACANCGCWLVDTCNACTVQISWKRYQLLHCVCGKFLPDEKAYTAPVAVFQLSRALQCVALGTMPTDIPVFNGLNLGQCVRLVRLLGAYGSNIGYSFPQKISKIDTLIVSWPITSMAAEILASWPTGLTELLENLRTQGKIEDKGRLSRAFSGFYSALYKGFCDAEFDFLRTDFENYVIERWTGATGKRNRRLDENVLKTMFWIPANHACRLLKISRRRLLDLIQEGRLRGDVRLTTGHREFIVVKRSDVEKLAYSLDEGVTLLDASIRLGLKKQRLLKLLPIICPQAKKLGAQGCPWAIPVNWIESWEILIRTQMQVESMASKTVALAHIIRYGNWTDEQIGLLLVDIFNGEIVPAGGLKPGKGIGTLSLHVDQLEHWFSGKQRVPCAELTIPSIALRIGIKQEVVYSLVRSGLLLATVRKVGRRSEQRVKVAVLEEFELRYILCRDIAQLLGRSSRAISKFLLADDVRPIAGPGIDNCRQIIFIRDDVVECLRRNGLQTPDD